MFFCLGVETFIVQQGIQVSISSQGIDELMRQPEGTPLKLLSIRLEILHSNLGPIRIWPLIVFQKPFFSGPGLHFCLISFSSCGTRELGNQQHHLEAPACGLQIVVWWQRHLGCLPSISFPGAAPLGYTVFSVWTAWPLSKQVLGNKRISLSRCLW